MRILFIAPPPSFPGRLHRIRAYQLIKYLSKSHEVFLLSLVSQWPDQEQISDLKPYCRDIEIIKQPQVSSWAKCALSLFCPIPLEVAYCHNQSLRSLAQKMIKAYDIDLIYLKRLRMSSILPLADLPVIIDSTDAMSLFYERGKKNAKGAEKFIFYNEAFKYSLYEKKISRQYGNWLICSDQDREYLRQALPDLNIQTIGNGVDLDFYQSEYQGHIYEEASNAGLEKDSLELDLNLKQPYIMFSGLMDKLINIDGIKYFVEHIWPQISRPMTDLHLYIIGPQPTKAIKSLASEKIKVMGYVPDLRPYIAQAQAIICPIRLGAGTKNKILQAWAMNKPVISTVFGASGLKAEDNENILLADQPSDFAAKVVQVLENKNLAQALGQNGLATIKEYYSMDKIIENLNKYITSLED